jgi:hypothetical protein
LRYRCTNTRINFMDIDLPRRYKARYASSMAGEINKNVILAPDEKIVYSHLVRERKNWLFGRPRLLAITPIRLILLEHNQFSADWILEIPCSALIQVSQEESLMSGWVNFTYSDMGEARCVRIQPMSLVPRRVSGKENQELFEVLSTFQQGELRLPIGDSDRLA